MDESIAPAELRHRLSSVRIVDIRRRPDGEQIPGSVRYNGAALGNSPAPPFAPNQEVVVYCGSGNTSSRVAADLRRHGIAAQALDGGYAAWREAGYETETLGDLLQV